MITAKKSRAKLQPFLLFAGWATIFVGPIYAQSADTQTIRTIEFPAPGDPSTGTIDSPSLSTAPLRAKVIAIYYDRNSTKFVVESNAPLVAGRNAYAGPEFVEITLGALLSRSEQLYYYNATVNGKPKVESGDAVVLELPQSKKQSVFKVHVKEHYVFSQKHIGEITAVQGKRAMIDRGSLHEVRERDIYRVYDASGGYKGLLEMRGIGDLQSSGKLYNALEDRRRNVFKTMPGDRVVFAGQRKLFALGLMGGLRLNRERVLHGREQAFGAGLLWSLTFPDGWGVEVLFGGFSRTGEAHRSGIFVDPAPPAPPTIAGYIKEDVEHEGRYMVPIWLKKNLFYPSAISPFVAAGIALFSGKNIHYLEQNCSIGCTENYIYAETAKTGKVVPVLGGGVEFFSGRFFRPRLELRWFDGPRLRAVGNSYAAESIFFSAGFLTTW